MLKPPNTWYFHLITTFPISNIVIYFRFRLPLPCVILPLPIWLFELFMCLDFAKIPISVTNSFPIARRSWYQAGHRVHRIHGLFFCSLPSYCMATWSFFCDSTAADITSAVGLVCPVAVPYVPDDLPYVLIYHVAKILPHPLVPIPTCGYNFNKWAQRQACNELAAALFTVDILFYR